MLVLCCDPWFHTFFLRSHSNNNYCSYQKIFTVSFGSFEAEDPASGQKAAGLKSNCRSLWTEGSGLGSRGFEGIGFLWRDGDIYIYIYIYKCIYTYMLNMIVKRM